MPVSLPSYFPAMRTTDRIVGLNAGKLQTGNRVFLAGLNAGVNSTISDLIVIGSSSAAGGLTDASGAGSVVIGSQQLATNPDLTTGASGVSGALTMVGFQSFASITQARRMAGLITIGAQIASAATFAVDGGMDRSVLIGNGVLGNNTLDNALSSDNIIIGHKSARRSGAGVGQFTENTIIGSQSGPTGAYNTVITGQTIIGALAGTGLLGGATGANNTIVGRRAGQTLTTGSRNTIVGQGAELGGIADDSIVVGANSVPGASLDSVFLGAAQSNTFSGSRLIVIGRGAGIGATAATGDQLFIETQDGVGTRRSWMYGSANGNLVLGNPAALTDRDLGGIGCTNAIKLVNGTRGVGNPVTGGFFYVAAGALHWVGSAGTDTVVAPA